MPELNINSTPQDVSVLLGVGLFGSGFFRCQNIDNDSTVLRRRDAAEPLPTAGAFRQPPGSQWEEAIVNGGSVWWWTSTGEALVVVENLIR